MGSQIPMGHSVTAYLRPGPKRPGRGDEAPALCRYPVLVASPRLAALAGPLQGTALPEGTTLAAVQLTVRTVSNDSWVNYDH
jgi:hypothetical protein